MARVHVSSWRETYRGLMSDAVLDDLGFVAARERFWTVALTDPRYGHNRSAVALKDDAIIGIAMAGPPLDDDATWTTQLYVLYVLSPQHGSGAGAALLDAVVPRDKDVALWVADPNPRAQAFYWKHAFRPDGTVKVEDGVREVRMHRPAQSIADNH
jgi:GNAT superfamily N-acetyltransferase